MLGHGGAVVESQRSAASRVRLTAVGVGGTSAAVAAVTTRLTSTARLAVATSSRAGRTCYLLEVLARTVSKRGIGEACAHSSLCIAVAPEVQKRRLRCAVSRKPAEV